MASTPLPTWDLDQYYLNYSGHGQIHRLRFVALKSQPLQIEALKHAIRLIKENTLYVSLYRETVEQLHALDSTLSEAAVDQIWVDQAIKMSRTTAEKLEAELKNYKNNLIKESIRVNSRFRFR
jgi:COP9 signalosome complex subunit 1